MKKYLAFDVGGTSVKYAVVNEEGGVSSSNKFKTPDTLEKMYQEIENVAHEYQDVEGIALSMPGAVDSDGGIIYGSSAIDYIHGPNIKEDLKQRLNKDVEFENDANCAALGEAYAGVGNGAKDFVAVTLGTGVGSGVIIDGKIVNGVNYAGGECGHMVIVVDGEQCSCGRKGCWEAYASATALIRQTKKAMEEYPDSLMHKLAKEEGKVSGRTAFDAMRLGDIAGIKVVDDYIKYVACGLINIVNALQPEIICIGGGICNEGETLMKPLRRFVQSERYSIHSKIQTKIVKAELGNDAGVIGAAILGKVK